MFFLNLYPRAALQQQLHTSKHIIPPVGAAPTVCFVVSVRISFSLNVSLASGRSQSRASTAEPRARAIERSGREQNALAAIIGQRELSNDWNNRMGDRMRRAESSFYRFPKKIPLHQHLHGYVVILRWEAMCGLSVLLLQLLS